MSWYRFRPVEHWPVEPTPDRERRAAPFKAGWRDTIRLLEDELAWLDASNVVLQCYAKNGDADIRMDGQLRASATVTRPGVIISFDSKHGPLSYPCDSCRHWQHNVRSIALALKALRAVDRYGVTGRAEQYRGWTKIAQPCEMQGFNTVSDAWEFINDLLDGQFSDENDSVKIRRALAIAHPDQGGTTKRFKLASAARDKILGGGV